MITDSIYLGQHLKFINSWLHESLCPYYKDYRMFATIDNCKTFMRNITESGAYSVIMNNYLNSNKFIAGIDFEGKNNSYFFNTKEWTAMQGFLRFMLPKLIEKYINYFVNLSKENIELAQRIKLIVLISSLCGVLIIFILLWIPYLVQLHNELIRTDSMLMLIPNEVIVKSKFLKETFEKKYGLIQ